MKEASPADAHIHRLQQLASRGRRLLQLARRLRALQVEVVAVVRQRVIEELLAAALLIVRGGLLHVQEAAVQGLVLVDTAAVGERGADLLAALKVQAQRAARLVVVALEETVAEAVAGGR